MVEVRERISPDNKGRKTVSSINFGFVKRVVTISDVARLIDWHPTSGTRVGRGKCPFHHSKSKKSRSFAVQWRKNMWYCHVCKLGGNHLELYARVKEIDVYEAAFDLIDRLELKEKHDLTQRRHKRTRRARQRRRA